MKPLYVATCLVGLTPAPLLAEEPVCIPSAEAEAVLIDWYGERPVSGSVEDGTVIWFAGLGQSWTVLSYEENGMSCTLAQGSNWSPDLKPHVEPHLLVASRN
jgi:hypothetical protein